MGPAGLERYAAALPVEGDSPREGPVPDPHGAVLIEYFALGDRLVAFVLRTDAERTEVVEPAVGLAEAARFVREQVVGTRRPLDDAEAWRDLAGRLVAPVLPLAAEGELLWFVGHDALHLLPLHAAPLGDDDAVILDRHPVCYAPSATVMHFCQRKQRPSRRSAFVVGDPRGDLPYAALEAEAVGRAFDAAPLLQTGATRDGVIEGLRTGGADVLHFACHGFFDEEQAMQSGIALADRNLTAQDLLGLELAPSVVTVSACRSGMQERRPGDELLGLTRALLYAGAPSVVVTLWPIDDLSTQLVMEAFYANLRCDRPLSLAAALRAAQLHVRDLPASAVRERCDEALEPLEAKDPRRVQLLAARATAESSALDYGAAAASCEEASAAADPRPEAKTLARSAALLRFKARAAETPDYARRPFADPYYWAPFLLHGDWR
jgi:CHAT domain-containing protein